MNIPVIPELTDLFIRFGIALALGLFIGFEREKEKHETFAGIRTFPLIALLGCTAALIDDSYVPGAFAVSFVTLSAMIITAYFFSGRQDRLTGITTAVAAYLCFLFGALVWWQLTALAAALAVVTVLLLATKKPLEGLSKKIEGREIAAALQFGVITLIILPILPNQTFGPLDVINPYTIWLMVVLIAGINFIGYILIKTLGARQGIGLAGLLGGMASSTALTLGFSRRSRAEPGLTPEFSFAIVVASVVMFARVLIEVFAVHPGVGRLLVLPLSCAGGAGLLCCAVLWFLRRDSGCPEVSGQTVAVRNPFELWPAIWFGLLFGAILFIARAGQVNFGTAGIYVSSIITGFADVDPIALSLSNLARADLDLNIAARGITLAALANTFVKMLITLIGGTALFRYCFPIFAVMIATGLIVSFVVM
jgi:uncharacterized membrane protein (DUF4010 family)